MVLENDTNAATLFNYMNTLTTELGHKHDEIITRANHGLINYEDSVITLDPSVKEGMSKIITAIT